MSMCNKESLSRRLMTICSMIDSCRTVVDVGSDHGKLSAFCLESQICSDVVATDIHELPANRTREYLASLGFESQSQVYCTDGLQGVEIHSDMVIVIAGMGGLEIRKILSNALSGSGIPLGTKFVLQPQRSQYELRLFLSEAGFAIEDEQISLDKEHFYTIMKVTYQGRSYHLDDQAFFLGPCILKNKPDFFEEFMAHEKKVMQKKALGDVRCAKILENWEDLL